MVKIVQGQKFGRSLENLHKTKNNVIFPQLTEIHNRRKAQMFEGLGEKLKAHFEDMAGTGTRDRLIGTVMVEVNKGLTWNIPELASPLMDYIARHEGDDVACKVLEDIPEKCQEQKNDRISIRDVGLLALRLARMGNGKGPYVGPTSDTLASKAAEYAVMDIEARESPEKSKAVIDWVTYCRDPWHGNKNANVAKMGDSLLKFCEDHADDINPDAVISVIKFAHSLESYVRYWGHSHGIENGTYRDRIEGVASAVLERLQEEGMDSSHVLALAPIVPDMFIMKSKGITASISRYCHMVM